MTMTMKISLLPQQYKRTGNMGKLTHDVAVMAMGTEADGLYVPMSSSQYNRVQVRIVREKTAVK